MSNLRVESSESYISRELYIKNSSPVAKTVSEIKDEAVITRVRDYNLGASGSITSHEQALIGVERAKELIKADPERAINAQGSNIPSELLELIGNDE